MKVPTRTKSQNTTILGQGGLASTQWSHPIRFRHMRPSFGGNGNPIFKRTAQNQFFFRNSDFDAMPT